MNRKRSRDIKSANDLTITSIRQETIEIDDGEPTEAIYLLRSRRARRAQARLDRHTEFGGRQWRDLTQHERWTQ